MSDAKKILKEAPKNWELHSHDIKGAEDIKGISQGMPGPEVRMKPRPEKKE